MSMGMGLSLTSCCARSLWPQDAPGVVEEDCSLADSKRRSKSNIDLSSGAEATEPRRPLPRKQSDSSTYDCEAVTQHHAFLSR